VEEAFDELAKQSAWCRKFLQLLAGSASSQPRLEVTVLVERAPRDYGQRKRIDARPQTSTTTVTGPAESSPVCAELGAMTNAETNSAAAIQTRING
jgi:hypothetical protein